MSLDYQNDNEIILSQEQLLEPAPEGRHPAICVDIVPVGKEETEYNGQKKMQEKVVLVFQVFPEDGSKDSEGQPFRAENKFTASLAPKAILRLKLEKWRGRDFTNDELKSFNLAKLKGVPCWLSILHNGNFANVVDIEAYLTDAGRPITPIPQAQNYTRREYKKKEASTSNGNSSATTTPATSADKKDDLIPF